MFDAFKKVLSENGASFSVCTYASVIIKLIVVQANLSSKGLVGA